MNIDMNITDKPKCNIDRDIQVVCSSDIVKLKEVQAIKNAIKEYLLFIGLDRGNNIRNVSVLGVGNNCQILIDSKEIVREALFSASDRVILVHNHPSNRLEPSEPDIHLTNVSSQILKAFNIQLLDHIIVTEKDYISMEQIKKINREYEDKSISDMNKGLLYEENQRLKNEINELKEQNQDKDFDLDMDY